MKIKKIRKRMWKKFALWFAMRVGFSVGKRRVRLLSDNQANEALLKRLRSKAPLMVCRYGGTEFSVLIGKNGANALSLLSGFFPEDEQLIPKFCALYKEDSFQIDVLGIWILLGAWKRFIKKKVWLKNYPNIQEIVSLSVISPSGTGGPNWLYKGLEGKRVLVVHPFKNSIESQLPKWDELGRLPLWESVEIFAAVQTLADQNDDRFETWFDALEYMKKEIERRTFDVCLVGCGAYGFPLAAHVKRLGKQAIHIGGALQLMFGIKGGRWENRPFDEHWIRPLSSDRPKGAEKVEEGCYW